MPPHALCARPGQGLTTSTPASAPAPPNLHPVLCRRVAARPLYCFNPPSRSPLDPLDEGCYYHDTCLGADYSTSDPGAQAGCTFFGGCGHGASPQLRLTQLLEHLGQALLATGKLASWQLCSVMPMAGGPFHLGQVDPQANRENTVLS